jgi:CarD family transcriptional regulator
VREPSNWSRRFKNHQEKLKSGDVYQVAEVVGTSPCARRPRGCPPARSPCWRRRASSSPRS